MSGQNLHDELQTKMFLLSCIFSGAKLLQSFGSRADVLEAAGSIAKRKEVLRKHKTMIEQEIGQQLDSNELAYLYGKSDASASTVAGLPSGGVGNGGQSSVLPPLSPKAQFYVNQDPQYHQHYPMLGAHQPIAYSNAQHSAYPVGPLQPHPIYAQQPAGYTAAHHAHQMAQLPYHSGALPQTVPPYGMVIPSGPGAFPAAFPGHNSTYSSSYPDAVSSSMGAQQQHRTDTSSSQPLHRQNSRGEDWFHNDRNLQRCNSRDDARSRKRSGSRDPGGNGAGMTSNLIRCNSRARSHSRDHLPTNMRLPSPFRHGYADGSNIYTIPAAGNSVNMQSEVTYNASARQPHDSRLEPCSSEEVNHGSASALNLHSHVSASDSGGLGRHSREEPQHLAEMMRRSRDYADTQLHNKQRDDDDRSIYSVASGGQGNTPHSEVPLCYSDDSGLLLKFSTEEYLQCT